MPPPDRVRAYDRIGDDYDRSRRADTYIVRRLLDLLEVRPSGRYIDAGCGTGNYTVSLAAGGSEWCGVDESLKMLSRAAVKSTGVQWVCGDLLDLPFPDTTFDGIAVTLVLHHLRSLNAGFSSLARVLAPRGRLVVFTSTAEQMREYWLVHYFPDAMARSIEQMPTLADLESAAASAQLTEIKREPYSVSPGLSDSFLYRGKFQPELYLDPTFRAGISTFTSLADATEVTTGCAKLASDIASGEFARVAARFDGSRGDYLFMVYTHGR
jgi:ubiquinone/menaquinone biosynthesis C-methylase UbiE